MPPKEEKRVSARSSSRAAAADREGRGASKYDNNNNSAPNSANVTNNNGGGDATNAAAAVGKKTKKSRPTSRAPQLDPLLLARGMSARYLSSKLTNNNVTPTPSTTTATTNTTKITPLDKNQIEKDLRHMEAYRNACNGYNQQLFVFNNQELVRSGYFGTFAPGVATTTTSELNTTATTNNNNADKKSTATNSNNNNNNFSMPIKIDPEKEKSLSLLRKKIQSSEFTREKLETEYLSLRAHYVHESQLVRKTHSYEMGRWKFMMELMKRRGRVLALMRCKVAMSRDVEKLLGYRGELLEGVRRGEIDPSVIGMLLREGGGGDVGDNVGGGEEEKGGGDKQQQQQDVVDFIQMWNDVDAKLKEAELACIELETPTELLQMVQQSTTSSDDGDKGSGGGGGGSKRRKRSSSMDESGDIYSNGDSRNKKNPIPSGMEPHVIPWDCIVEPQTPYEVPILLSCLSSATDRALGYVTDRSNPTAITWLTSTLPESTSAFTPDSDELRKYKEEARLLEEELNRETELNTELQRQIIASRSRGDEMAALMQLMRSETEAVLERHNLIMETPEARAKAAELHKKFLEEQKLNNPSGGGDEEVGDVDENEDMSRDEEEGDEMDDDDDRSDDDSVGIKEITVDKTDDNDGSDEEDEGSGSDGEMEGGEPRRSKRGNSSAGDEESSSLTPPNQTAQRKRRRF